MRCPHTTPEPSCPVCHILVKAMTRAGKAPPPQEGPGLLRRIGTFAGALASHLAAGLPQATPEEKARRLSLCVACDLYDSARKRCRHQNCGCNLDKKAGWADQHCPLRKW